MYCSFCGHEIPENSAFCLQCGAQLAPSPLAPVQTVSREVQRSEAIRQKEAIIEEMQQLMTYFDIKKADYQRFDEACYTYDNTKMGFRAWGIVLPVISTVLIWFLLSTNSFGASFRIEGILGISALVLVGIIGPLFGAISDTRGRIKKRNNAENTAASLYASLSEYYRAYGYCPVGFEYSDPATLRYIYMLLCNGRADSIKEAINLMLTDIHNKNMEQAQQVMLAKIDESVRAARSAARWAAASAVTSVVYR